MWSSKQWDLAILKQTILSLESIKLYYKLTKIGKWSLGNSLFGKCKTNLLSL